MNRVLIKGGCLLSMDRDVGNHREADVLIEDDAIAEVGANLRVRDAEVVDAADAIVMPGFVDTHRHVWHSLFRGLGGIVDTSVLPNGLGRGLSADDVYAATLVGLSAAVEAGITTVVDWSDVDSGHREAALQAHADAGLRTVLVLTETGGAAGGWRSGVEDLDSRLVTMAAGLPSPKRQDLDRLSQDWALARRLGLRIHSHTGTDGDDRDVVTELAARGLLGDDVTLVHCSRLSGADFDAIASSKTAVSLAPSSEMADGLGQPPVQQLIDRGIRPGLGVDSERLAPADMFAPMRAAISLQHGTIFDLKLSGKAGLPALMSTREVIRWATIDGAVAIGLGQATGSLTPGKQADIVVLRTDRPNIAPVNDPIGAVVWGMDTSNVDWVFAGGRPLMRNGVLDADLDRIRTLAAAAQHRVASSVGIPVWGSVGAER